MSIEANKDVVHAFYAQAATGERDEELVAAGLRYHGPDMRGDLQGREAFVQLLSGFRSAFPGFETDVHRMIAEGDIVAVWHTHSGTHTGSSPAFPPQASTSSSTGWSCCASLMARLPSSGTWMTSPACCS